MMKVFPVITAGPNLPSPKSTGQFQGTLKLFSTHPCHVRLKWSLTIPAHTPKGGNVEYTTFSSSSCNTSSLISIVANARTHSRLLSNSVFDKDSGLPCSRVKSFSNASRFSSRRSAYWSSNFARSENGVALQGLKARRAASTAALRSSRRAMGTSYSGVPLAGSIEWRVFGVAISLLLMMLPE